MDSTLGHSARYSQARRYRRFHLQFPVCLSFPAGEAARKVDGVSKNVSLGGLLVKTEDVLPISTPVDLTVNVMGWSSRRPILLHGEGKVVRVVELARGAGFEIAVKCTRPITELRSHVPAR
ncbi:MAG TPA: PilZ domain-containing protein [Candidatus Acidoferrales bacterium]|nr:PilZ domain-containing protein [Candidatus Acidoferrales bacterium]